MKMNVNIDTSIDNLLYLDYMKQQQLKEAAESNVDENNICCSYDRPQDKKTE